MNSNDSSLVEAPVLDRPRLVTRIKVPPMETSSNNSEDTNSAESDPQKDSTKSFRAFAKVCMKFHLQFSCLLKNAACKSSCLPKLLLTCHYCLQKLENHLLSNLMFLNISARVLADFQVDFYINLIFLLLWLLFRDYFYSKMFFK